MKNVEKFKKLPNKLEVIMNQKLLSEYFDKLGFLNPKDNTVSYYFDNDEYREALEYLNDDERLELINTDFFEEAGLLLRREIIKSIKDDDKKINLLQDEDFFIASINNEYNAVDIINTLSEEKKIQVLKDYEQIIKWNISGYQIEKIVSGLSDENIKKIVSDEELVKGLKLRDYNIADIVCAMKEDKNKLELMSKIKSLSSQNILILDTCSYDTKKQVLIEDNFKFNKNNIISIIKDLEIKDCIDFFKNNKQFLKDKEIRLFDIVRSQGFLEQQLNIVYNMDKFDLSESEKRMIIAGLKNEAKENLDFNLIDSKYKELAQLKLVEEPKAEIYRYEKIVPDLNSDLSLYKDLDELISIVPQIDIKTEKDKQQFEKLCELCPNLPIRDKLGLGYSSVEEYIEGEKWIDSVLSNLKNDWTQIQKMAYIHTSIGKTISYTPEDGTEVEKPDEERPIWKIIVNKNGVCNGIAQLEQYMFNKIGIESELVNSDRHIHCFLKAKNVEIPTKDGIKIGDTLLDPTWDLANSKFDSKLHHFCRNYEEIRKYDIDYNGIDTGCHENKELEKSDLIEMDEQTLRKVCTSIGVADKEGKFLITKLMDAVILTDILCKNEEVNIATKIHLLKINCPEFAECINSTIKIMKDLLFQKNETFNYNKCVVSRVFDKSDDDKKAVLFAYFDFAEKGKRFYYADKEKGDFIGLSQEDFEKRFDCYESDIKNNKRLWEQEKAVEEQLKNSSGRIVECDDR